MKTEALLHMDRTERNPTERPIAAIMDLLDSRYPRADSERACAWLAAFTESKRETNENYKDFWGRFSLCVARREALGVPMEEKVVFNRSIRALRLPGGELAIAFSALETRPDRFSVKALQEITIRMYETHKFGGDSTEVYATTTHPAADSQDVYHTGENEWTDDERYGDNGDWEADHEEGSEIMLDDGSIMLMKPKNRLSPGIHQGFTKPRGEAQSRLLITSQTGRWWDISVAPARGPAPSLEGMSSPLSRAFGPSTPLKRKREDF